MARRPSCGVRGVLHGRAHAFEEDEVVRRGLGRAAIDDDALDRLAEQRGPVIGLLGAHRPAIDHLHAVDAEQLGQQAALLHDVVVGRDLGKLARRSLGRVRRRRRQAVGEHVGNDDEIAAGIEAVLDIHQPFDVGVMRRVARRIDDDVVALGRERAVGLVDDARGLERAAALQREVAAVEDALASLSSPRARSRADCREADLARCTWM